MQKAKMLQATICSFLTAYYVGKFTEEESEEIKYIKKAADTNKEEDWIAALEFIIPKLSINPNSRMSLPEAKAALIEGQKNDKNILSTLYTFMNQKVGLIDLLTGIGGIAEDRIKDGIGDVIMTELASMFTKETMTNLYEKVIAPSIDSESIDHRLTLQCLFPKAPEKIINGAMAHRERNFNRTVKFMNTNE